MFIIIKYNLVIDWLIVQEAGVRRSIEVRGGGGVRGRAVNYKQPI